LAGDWCCGSDRLAHSEIGRNDRGRLILRAQARHNTFLRVPGKWDIKCPTSKFRSGSHWLPVSLARSRKSGHKMSKSECKASPPDARLAR
jgi:hypothetical protein